MEKVEKLKAPSDGKVISIWMKGEVLAALDGRVMALKRSRSWLVDNVLREKLGFPPDNAFKGQDKL